MEKVTKTTANYRSHPNGQEWCARCVMFRQPDQCSKVKGQITRTGWCQFFYSKAKEKKDD